MLNKNICVKDNTLYNYPEFHSFKELIDIQVSRSANQVAFVFEQNGTYVNKTYQEFRNDIFITIDSFYFKEGAKVAFVGQNSYEYIVGMFSVLYAGGIAVPIESWEFMKSQKGLSDDCDMVFCEKLINDSDNDKHKWISINDIGKELQNKKDRYNKPIDSNSHMEDVALIIHTSGTMGGSKGVSLTNKNVCKNIYCACRTLNLKKRMMLLLPLYHMYGILSLCVVIANSESTFIVVDKKRLFCDMKVFQPKQLIVVPLYVESFYKMLLSYMKQNGIDEQDFECVEGKKGKVRSILADSLETIICGGAPLNTMYVEFFQNLGIDLLNGYGITECSPLIAVNTKESNRKKSVGKVIECCEVCISNKHKGIGEIFVRGDNVMKGYYKDTRANEKAFENGWFKTGDLGYIDKDGFLFVCGRKKNIIICSNGENVSPEELEDVIIQFKVVNEVIVYACNDQYICAEIYPNYEWAKIRNIDDVQAYLMKKIEIMNSTLPNYKRVERVIIRQFAFKRSSSGKIIRRA